MLQCVAECCSVLQCVAVCCSVVAVFYSVFQCVAVCCSVLQFCAVFYSVLQRVAHNSGSNWRIDNTHEQMFFLLHQYVMSHMCMSHVSIYRGLIYQLVDIGFPSICIVFFDQLTNIIFLSLYYTNKSCRTHT